MSKLNDGSWKFVAAKCSCGSVAKPQVMDAGRGWCPKCHVSRPVTQMTAEPEPEPGPEEPPPPEE